MKVARRFLLTVLFSLVAGFGAQADAAPVLMISIDGLKPEYITHADEHGMKLPFLCSMMRNGTYADGVVGVWPTVTYPSHTTLVTGVWPAEHGILNNQVFDPMQKFYGAWNWYAGEIRVPTLWTAAKQAGQSTASVGWPVSVGDQDIDWLIPEYWRMDVSGSLNQGDAMLMAALARPGNLIQDIERSAGPYMNGNNTTVEGDEIKTRYTLEILKRHRPQFMTLHLSSLDEEEHLHGPFSTKASADLEALDGMVERLAKQEMANDPSSVVVVVSDHGFMNITHTVNLMIPFLHAGLIEATVNPSTKATGIGSWKAMPWLVGGMAPIMLRDPNDENTKRRVKDLLDKLAADPANGIVAVLDPSEIAERGGFPGASFLVVLKPGYVVGPGVTGDLVAPIEGTRGTHGFSPEYAEMHSSFFAVGTGIAQHRSLGVVDMRQIAPTVAHMLGVAMPSAKAAPLNVQQ